MYTDYNNNNNKVQNTVQTMHLWTIMLSEYEPPWHYNRYRAMLYLMRKLSRERKSTSTTTKKEKKKKTTNMSKE